MNFMVDSYRIIRCRLVLGSHFSMLSKENPMLSRKNVGGSTSVTELFAGKLLMRCLGQGRAVVSKIGTRKMDRAVAKK